MTKEKTNKNIDEVLKNALSSLRKTGWYPHLKKLGYRSLAEFEGAYLRKIESVIEEVEKRKVEEIIKFISKWKAETDIGSPEIDTLYLHLKSLQ